MNAWFGHACPAAHGLQGHTADLSVVSSVNSMWRLSKSSLFSGSSFVIPIIIHNSTGEIYRVFLVQLQCQRCWLSPHLPHALDESPDTAILPATEVERKTGFCKSWHSYREMCHLDLKHSFYFPNSYNNKRMVKWFV